MNRVLALLFAFSLAGLFDRPDPSVEAANQAYAKGEYDKALRGYEDAQIRIPDDPRLAYDRGNALYKLGRRDEARQAYLTALGAREDSLKTQDWFNLGNALWDLGKKDEAAQAYQRALMLDPTFDDARHNLELLLQPPPPQDGGSPDAGSDGGQGDGGRQPSSPDGGQGDGGGDGGASDGGGQGQSQQQGGQDGGQGDGGEQQLQPQDQDGGAQPQPQMADRDAGVGDEHDERQAQAQPLNEQQAQQLLDALRQREKNFQLWKFRIKHQRTQEVEKDW